MGPLRPRRQGETASWPESWQITWGFVLEQGEISGLLRSCHQAVSYLPPYVAGSWLKVITHPSLVSIVDRLSVLAPPENTTVDYKTAQRLEVQFGALHQQKETPCDVRFSEHLYSLSNCGTRNRGKWQQANLVFAMSVSNKLFESIWLIVSLLQESTEV